jgi:hypothetical protein
VAAIFDYSMKVHEIQKVQYWIKLIEKVNEMLSLAKQHNDVLSVSCCVIVKFISHSVESYLKCCAMRQLILYLCLRLMRMWQKMGKSLRRVPIKSEVVL